MVSRRTNVYVLTQLRCIQHAVENETEKRLGPVHLQEGQLQAALELLKVAESSAMAIDGMHSPPRLPIGCSVPMIAHAVLDWVQHRLVSATEVADMGHLDQMWGCFRRCVQLLDGAQLSKGVSQAALQCAVRCCLFAGPGVTTVRNTALAGGERGEGDAGTRAGVEVEDVTESGGSTDNIGIVVGRAVESLRKCGYQPSLDVALDALLNLHDQIATKGESVVMCSLLPSRKDSESVFFIYFSPS